MSSHRSSIALFLIASSLLFSFTLGHAPHGADQVQDGDVDSIDLRTNTDNHDNHDNHAKGGLFMFNDKHGHDHLSPGVTVLLLFFSMMVAQALLYQWKLRSYRTYHNTTLFFLWILPCLMSLRLMYWRFILSWVVFSLLTGYFLVLASKKPLASDTPRRVYSFFSLAYRLFNVLALLGYLLLIATILGLDVLMGQFLPSSGVLLLFYGMYYGVMGRDCAEMCSGSYIYSISSSLSLSRALSLSPVLSLSLSLSLLLSTSPFASLSTSFFNVDVNTHVVSSLSPPLPSLLPSPSHPPPPPLRSLSLSTLSHSLPLLQTAWPLPWVITTKMVFPRRTSPPTYALSVQTNSLKV